MEESFELHGIWWTPVQPEKKYTGTVRYLSGQGTLLSLMGFTEEFGQYPFDEMHPSIINGVTTEGKKVTLQGCSFEGSGSM